MTRRYGEGSISWDARDGRWIGRVQMGTTPDGRYLRKKVSGRTKEEVRRKVREVIRARDDGTITAGPDMTVAQWLTYWTETVLPGTLAPRTVEQYAQVAKDYIAPVIGKVKLQKLRPEDVTAMIRFHQDRGMPDAAVKARKILHRGLEIAMRWGKVSRNVAALTDPPQGAGPRIGDALDEIEVEAVLEAARGDRLEAMAHLVLTMGMRQGEVLRLRWSDLDEETGLLTVFGTKGAAQTRVRVIPVPAFVMPVLRRHRAAQRKERISAKYWEEPDLMFTTTVGTLIHRRNALRWWHELTIKAGIGRRRFHASRHAAATVLLNNGVGLEVVRSILGHASLAITADVYAEVRPGLLRTGADVMDRLFGKEAR